MEEIFQVRIRNNGSFPADPRQTIERDRSVPVRFSQSIILTESNKELPAGYILPLLKIAGGEQYPEKKKTRFILPLYKFTKLLFLDISRF